MITKRKNRNFLLVCLIITSLIVALISPTVFAEEDFKIQAKAAVAIDAETGKVFYEQNADKPLPIASMTKLLTLYLILEAEKEGKISWDEQVEISDHLLKISQDLNLSNIIFVKGSSYSVKDLFNASTLVSANAAITALAEKVSGTEKNFIDAMRAKVESWGISDAYLISTSGINNEDAQGRVYPGSKKNEENLMSAKSVALVAQHLIKDFPEFLELSKQPSMIFAEGTDEEVEMHTSNWMLPGYYYYKEGVDGLKTGTTDLAGMCFAGTIKRDDWRLITVVMNVDDSEEEGSMRFPETARLMDYVYDNWQYTAIHSKGDTLPTFETIGVHRGEKLTVPVVADADLNFWVRKDMDKNNIKVKLTDTNNELDEKNRLLAPVKKGEVVGEVVVEFPEDTLGYLEEAPASPIIPLRTEQAVKHANWFVVTGRTIKEFFSDLSKE